MLELQGAHLIIVTAHIHVWVLLHAWEQSDFSRGGGGGGGSEMAVICLPARLQDALAVLSCLLRTRERGDMMDRSIWMLEILARNDRASPPTYLLAVLY